MPEYNSIHELSENLKQYIKTTIEIIKLEILQRSIIISSYIMVKLLGWIVFIVAFIFLSIALGFYISEYVKSYATGFGLVGFVYLFVALLISFFNRRKIEKRLQNKIIRHIYSEKQTVTIP
jgi:hypothetical protein